jgi:Uma2 family endonuclease
MNASALASPQLRLFTVGEYYRMLDAGILKEDDRVELIEGEIVAMSPIGSRHAACVDTLAALLVRAFSSESLIVRIQNPLHLSEYSEPQPDLSVVRARLDRYRTGHPTANDVVFVIEVADASLAYDRHTKIPLYARYGIAEVWLVDLESCSVIVHSAPGPTNYEYVHHFEGSALLPQLGVPASEIFV